MDVISAWKVEHIKDSSVLRNMNFKLKHWHLNGTSFSEALGIFTHVLAYGSIACFEILSYQEIYEQVLMWFEPILWRREPCSDYNFQILLNIECSLCTLTRAICIFLDFHNVLFVLPITTILLLRRLSQCPDFNFSGIF